MRQTSLSELIAITQENIQRSYDFSNDLTEAYRLSNDENIILSLKEMKISVPVACSIESVAGSAVSAEEIAKEGGLSLAEAALRNPRMSPEQRLELRSAFLTKLQTMRTGETNDAAATPQAAKKPVRRSAARKRRSPGSQSQGDASPASREELMVSLINGKDMSEIEELKVGTLELTFAASLR